MSQAGNYSEQNENPLMKMKRQKGSMSEATGHQGSAQKTFVLKGLLKER